MSEAPHPRRSTAHNDRRLALHYLGMMGLLSALGARSPGTARAQSVEATRGSALTSDGVRLSVLHVSPSASTGPTLMFVPGWCMPASIWRAQLAALGEYYSCIALDPRGQGQSEAPSFGYTMDRRAADIAEAIGTRSRVVLIGWSLGGLESLHYVHRYGAERLAAMVLVDNSVGEPPVPAGSNVIARLKADREATVDRFARSLFTSPRPQHEIDEIKSSMLRIRLEDSIALLSGQPPREHWRAIARGFAKTLVYAVTSRYQEQAASLKKHRPETRIEIFRSAGHALFVDEPERFNRIVSDVAATVPESKNAT